MTNFNKKAANREDCVYKDKEGWLLLKRWKPFVESKYNKLGDKDDKGREYSFCL